MKLVHKDCGGEIREGELREYNFGPDENYGWIPDLICDKCGSVICGDAEITSDDPFFNACYG